MKNSFLEEILISTILVVLLVLLLNPWNFWMPDPLLMMMVIALLIAFGAFATLLWREHAEDERESLHRGMAGRAAFLAGASMLVIGIAIQGLSHAIDPWLVAALGVMVLAKIAVLVYSRIKL